MKKSLQLLALIMVAMLLSACNQNSNEKKIGVIVPIEHKAMDEIVAGFSEQLRKISPYPVKIKVANAQGDANLQRAIITQMRDENYAIIVPIGTTTTQMTAAMVQQQPIVSIAAVFSQSEREQRKSCNIAVVHDEISPTQILKFIHLAYPNMTKIILIHSASEKIFPEVTESVAAAKKLGIEIQPKMVQTLNELYSMANVIPSDTQAIFILKDNLIASGISTLVQTAQKLNIPLITSDQGTVQDGATFALGVPERQIGVYGADLAAKILGNQSACSLPIVNMDKLTVFINKSHIAEQSLQSVSEAAKKSAYDIEVTK